MNVQTLVTGPFAENCYLVSDESSGHAAIIDPGDDGEQLIHAIRNAHVELDAIWVTHAHLDHVGAIAVLKRAFGVPIWLHPLDLPLYERTREQGAAYGLAVEQPPPPDREFADGMTLTLGSLSFVVMEVPGHARPRRDRGRRRRVRRGLPLRWIDRPHRPARVERRGAHPLAGAAGGTSPGDPCIPRPRSGHDHR